MKTFETENTALKPLSNTEISHIDGGTAIYDGLNAQIKELLKVLEF